jgi:hypothetical protein
MPYNNGNGLCGKHLPQFDFGYGNDYCREIRRNKKMTEMILNSDILPEPIFELVHTERIKVREVDGVISIIPAENAESVDYIGKLKGSCSDGKLTVEKFLAQKRADKESEI